MTNRAKEIAKALLETKAVNLNVNEPFTFSSGIKSPIYCDNRKLIGFISQRELIVNAFVEELKKYDFDVVAGTATAGIPWAAFVAQSIKKPMCYIRSQSKDHGKGKQIEGANVNNKKVIIIEDLISTGGSSIKAAKASLEEGASQVLVISIFSYAFPSAFENFRNEGIEWSSMSDFPTLIEVAKESHLLNDEEIKVALQWNWSPSTWK